MTKFFGKAKRETEPFLLSFPCSRPSAREIESFGKAKSETEPFHLLFLVFDEE